MSDKELLERALAREKKAREHAEFLLEEKTREIYLSHQNLQTKHALLEEKNVELALLAHITDLGDNTIETGGALLGYLEAICEACDWPVGHIYSVNENTDASVTLEPTDLWCLSDTVHYQDFVSFTMNTTFNAEEGLPGQVYATKEATWMKDVFADLNTARSAKGHEVGLFGGFGIPIFRYGKLIAIAEFFSTEPEEKNPALIEIAVTAATQLSVVIERRFSEKQLADNYQELKEAHDQLKETQAQLLQSAKLASVGQLAAGVAHEINNPIGYVANNTSVMKKYVAKIKSTLSMLDDTLETGSDIAAIKESVKAAKKKNNIDFVIDDIDSLIEDSLEGMTRVTDIVQGLKNFSRSDEAEIKEVSINECLDATIKIIWNELKYKCTLDKQLDDLPPLRCYPSQLNQVFMNLLVNAGQAIEEHGDIIIKTQDKDGAIIVSVSDTGSGIAPESLEKLYDPFFTTKPVGTGTGLGLSISYGIIQKHGGRIDVDSTLGQGTTFTLTLPHDGISAQ